MFTKKHLFCFYATTAMLSGGIMFSPCFVVCPVICPVPRWTHPHSRWGSHYTHECICGAPSIKWPWAVFSSAVLHYF